MPGGAAHAVIDTDETLARVFVTYGGVYENGEEPDLLITGGGGADAAASSVLDLDYNMVEGIHVFEAGQDYEATPSTPLRVVFTATGGGKGLQGTATLTTAGFLKEIFIGTGGTGYTTAACVIDDTGTGGSGGAATPNLSYIGRVVGVNVITGGLFKTTPLIEFVPVSGGSGAAATATINLANGTVVEFANFVPDDTITPYTIAPNVVFTPPSSTPPAIYHVAQAVWPPNYYFHTDEKTGIVVNITKQVVPHPTYYPGRSGYRGPFIDQQPYDVWKTVQFTSKVDLTTLPIPEAWNTTHPFSLPPRLQEIICVWSTNVSKLANAEKKSCNVRVSSGLNGGIIVKGSSGFHGRVRAKVGRYYIYGSPLPDLVPVPFVITPSSGSVVMRNTHSSTQASRGDDGANSIGDAFQSQIHSLDVRDHIVGIMGLDWHIYKQDEINGRSIADTSEIIVYSPPQSAFAQSGGGSVIAVAAAGTPSRVTIEIPRSILYNGATTPPQYFDRLTPGQWILWDVNPEEWRFGIWVVDQILIQIPPF